MSKELSIIIPAAGLGRRMKSYGPKPLVDLNNKYNVINWQLSTIRKLYPHAEIVVVVGYESDLIAKNISSDVKIVENELYENTNVVRSIGMGLRVANRPNVLVIYGDLVFNQQAIKFPTNKSQVVIDCHNQMDEDEVGLTIIDGRVTQMTYDLPIKWGQIIYLTGHELSLFKKIAWDRNCSKWFGFEAINWIVSNGGIIRAIEPKDMLIVEIDSARDIEKARTIV